MESESHASRIVSAIKIYDTFERSALKIQRGVFVSCSRTKTCNFSGLLRFCSGNFPQETFPVVRATQLWRSMRKTTSCKETRESPGCFSSLIGQKKFWPIRSRQFKRFWNWFGKCTCPGASLNLTENFHHEHCIVPTVSAPGSPRMAKTSLLLNARVKKYRRPFSMSSCVLAMAQSIPSAPIPAHSGI